MVLEQRALTIVIVNFVFLGLSTITLALRCLVRVTREAFGLDDWMILLGWIMFVVNVSMSTMSAIHGLGVHNLTITAAEMEPAVKYFTIFQIFTLTGTLPVKASICISLMRITPSLTYRKILYAIMAGSVATVLISDVVVIVTCRPMAFTWDKTIPDGKCSSINAILILSYCFSAMNIITDLSTALIPAFIVWNLKLSPRIKVAISILLGMGMFASIATIIRVKYFPNYAKAVDYLYGVAPIVWWSTIEIGLGIIAACLSALRPLLRFALGNGSYGPSDDRPSPPTIATPHKKGYMKARAIRLRNIEDGLATTMVTGAGNETADNYNESINASDGDKSSQRGILQHIPEQPEPKCTGKEVGILVTQSYKIEDEDTEDNVSKDRGCKYNGSNESRERTIQDIV
ncbi:uncharacterized protein EAE97_002897 [Botrytis byssoidea]|uniref:Rhodopsin domain-containing protein n=1 Tax=Botrytis byssoidea TaxID=139641 RepID=A0A9P5IPE2_9HELO|nr:uncharacterized protein EAE97_002897 [Botrytis byssoidea]KAF7949388.1 hypothetical protein EAE97_002897 [Botrytis byssoidea]